LQLKKCSLFLAFGCAKARAELENCNPIDLMKAMARSAK
jgi:hypothetical protein